MEQVAYKSPMPLQTQVLYTFFAYAVVFFQVLRSNSSLVKILVDHKSWQIPRALPFPPCFRRSIFPAYSMVICCVTADRMANILLPWLFDKESTHDCG